MESVSQANQESETAEFQDMQRFRKHKNLKRNKMFDEQFIDFMRWLKKDVRKTYSKADFQRMFRQDILVLVVGYISIFLAYLAAHSLAPGWVWLWGPPLFIVAIGVGLRGEVLHMRSHNPSDLTGNHLVDRTLDYLGLAVSGVSPNLFHRRHTAAHYNDVGSVSKIFSNIWLTFDKVPIVFYLRPFLLLRFIANRKFCEEELIDRKVLAWETLFFYGYIAIFAFELFYLDSYFLLVFHLLPGLFTSGALINGAITVHSGMDSLNTFESNGLMDPKTAKGLFGFSLRWFSLFNAGFYINHMTHHAYPTMPLRIADENYERYYAHILSNYKDVRYNTVLQHRIQGDLLDKLPKPGFFAYVVAFFVNILVQATLALVGLGVPIPPVLFELLLVDWRIYVYTNRYERAKNKIRFMESIDLAQRYKEIEDPNSYLKFYFHRYGKLKAYVKGYEAKHNLSHG